MTLGRIAVTALLVALVATLFTVAAGLISPHLVTEPFGEGVWWHSFLRMAGPALWLFLLFFMLISGVAWLIGALSENRDRPE